jgi:Cu/Ag efflux protein CusF
MMKRICILVTLLLIAWTAAQAQPTSGPESAQGKPWKVGTPPSMPLTDSEVERVDKERAEVIINHGDLPNLGMPAMTMGFNVADTNAG